MNKKPKICLILDNPLRDLEGLVLVAWHLTKLGAEVWLVPMYNQAFDVRAIGTDFVLMNYVRTNNLNHIISYMRNGIKVGVLDTEGMGGKSTKEFADLVSKAGGATLVDLYCAWGKGQYDALLKQKVVPETKLQLTGCPRYDYCSTPWRNCLPQPNTKPDYILINTNFPTVNSRFVRNSDDEIVSMINAGFTADFAADFIRDAHTAHLGMIKLIQKLVAYFPDQHFILRPHPFESTAPYEEAIKAKNFEVRQERTSIEWLNHAKVLIQLNCLTAIESTAFNVPALSPSWLNTPALNVPLSSNLSINFDNEDSFVEHLSQELTKFKDIHNTPNKNTPAQNHSIIEEYLLCDGKAAQRVAQVIMDELANKNNKKELPKLPLRFYAINMLQSALGYSLYNYLQSKLHGNALNTRKKSKLFSIEQVTSIINRIENSTDTHGSVRVSDMSSTLLRHSYLASGSSVCLSSTDTHHTKNV